MNRKEKTIQELNLEDDFLFAKVMSDPEICRQVLEQLLGISIRQVILPESQKTIDILYEGKGIRLDVYVNDENGTVYNVEMQRGRRRDLPKRARYYQGNLDLDQISAGEPYSALKRTYVIFICTFDPFYEGRYRYTFENTCRENPSLALGDGTVKLFLNTRGDLEAAEEGVRDFLIYVEHTTNSFAAQARSPLIRLIHKKVLEVKASEEMEVEFMTLAQRDRENIEIGREEGREEGRTLTFKIIELYGTGLSVDAIADKLELKADFVAETIQAYERLR